MARDGNIVVYACPNTNRLVCENVVEIFNANVAYSVKQLTADCVHETSFHFGFIVENDYNIRFRTV